MPRPEREPVTEKERLAVVEHRVSKTEEAITNIEKWTEKLTSLCTQLVKLETEHTHNRQRVERLENRMDTSEFRYNESASITNTNKSWVEWFKVGIISLGAAGLGAGVTILFGG